MLNSIPTLKRYRKTNLNVFFNKKIVDDDKKILSIGRFFVKVEILLLTCKNCLKFQIYR